MKQIKRHNAFQIFLKTLSADDNAEVQAFLKNYAEHMDMSRPEERLITEDAKNALMYLTEEKGMDLSAALKRLSSENLGGFYAHEALAWYSLDDAAKIYPLSMKFGRMPIFRLSCYLQEDVVPEILQLALDFTIKRFPSFATIVRKGIFWHYLDSIKRRFPIAKDLGIPCQPLRITSIGVQSFKVLYYKNRISAEFFHVLTDGSGGMVFLKTLTAEYLRLLGAPKVTGSGVRDINTPPNYTELSNDFERFCPKTKKSGGFSGPAALQMGGKISRHSPCKVVHMIYKTQNLLDLAHKTGVSLTALMLAMMFLSQKSATELDNRLIQMQVPVDMRKFFKDSDTVRNFAMYCSVDIAPSKVNNLESLAHEISRQISEKGTFEEMSVMMATARKLVKSLRFVPLALKSPVAKIIYGFLGDSRFSNTLSNIGVVDMPEALKPYIKGFDFVLGTCVVSRASCAMCSFGGNTVLSISKNTKDPSFEERLHILSEELGLSHTISETMLHD